MRSVLKHASELGCIDRKSQPEASIVATRKQFHFGVLAEAVATSARGAGVVETKLQPKSVVPGVCLPTIKIPASKFKRIENKIKETAALH